MAYTTNPHLPKVRIQAVRLVRSGWSVRKVARHLGYTHSAVVKWCAKAPNDRRKNLIPTESSRPHHHPNELDEEIVDKIIEYREKYRRCAEVIHHLLKRDGIVVSLSSVKRTLKRNGMTRYSKWKKWHQYPPRPIPENPGILVQIDTVHRIVGSLYVYTMLDVMSRWACADVSEKIGAGKSVEFVRNRKTEFPFLIRTLQSDHGPEFSKWFTKQMIADGISHRHSHVRRPTDNGHLERFNRTIQEECLDRIPQSITSYKKEIPEYLHWYNTKRPHMGLDMKSPKDILKVVPSY